MWSHFLLSAAALSMILSFGLDLSGLEPEQFELPPYKDLQVFEKRHADNFADEEELKLIEPYLIPDEHKMKIALDTIFSIGGVLASPESMKNAGFKLVIHRKGRGLVVAKHPLLKKYLVKTYLDTAIHVDWTSWVRRAKGARLVQACISAKPRCARYTKVPQKWIYHIPLEARGEITENNIPREFLLLVEDMQLVNKEENEHLYQTAFSEKFLHVLHYVVNKSGYSDCHIANLPFSKDGKIAFIDTEYTNTWPIHPQWLTKWFSPRRQVYWEGLFAKP